MAAPATATFGADSRPNFVLFIADDVSQGDFGCYGHPTIKTPHIDRLAAEGLRFTNAYLTTSSCSPTRTSLITGRYPHNTGAPELHMSNSPHLGKLPQFPHKLRQAGYYTAQAGKWHFNGDANKSFDDKAGGGPSGAENWVPTLRKRPRDKPFFLWFAATDAHRTWDQSISAGPQSPENVQVPPYMVDDEATRRDLAHYDNEVHRYDANIGKVVRELKRQQVYENTVLIVIADNGRPFPRDKTWLYDAGIKTPLVIHWPAGLDTASEPDSLVSVIDLPPTILELAGVDMPDTFQGRSLVPIFNDPESSVRDFVFAERNWHGQRYHERLVRYGDFVYIRNHLPELTGFNLVHWGKDQAGKYIKGNQQGAYVSLVSHWRAGKANAAQQDVVKSPRPAEMLFDVGDDPHQLRNLADDSRYDSQLALLRAAVNQWMKQTGDTVPDFDDMTPDRMDRKTWEPVGRGLRGGRTGGGEVPGETTEAWKINNPGPVRESDLKQQ